MSDEFEQVAYELICLSRFGAVYHGMVKNTDIKLVANHLRKNMVFLNRAAPQAPALPPLPKIATPPLPKLPALPPLPKLPK